MQTGCSYSDAFFTTAVTDPIVHKISRAALYESEPVGWIRCRLEPCSPNSSQPCQIYIQALAVLSPYRNLGLATSLLNEILSAAASLEEQPVCIYAHVWEKNEDALDWYAKRCFKRVMLLERYYLKLRPSGAWIVRRELSNTGVEVADRFWSSSANLCSGYEHNAASSRTDCSNPEARPTLVKAIKIHATTGRCLRQVPPHGRVWLSKPLHQTVPGQSFHLLFGGHGLTRVR